MNMSSLGAHGGPDRERSTEPQVFVRSLTAPGGLPWEQTKAAELEARMSAPAAVSSLRYRLVRLEPWRLGRPGRFAAVYLKGGEEIPAYEADVLIEGRSVKVAFPTEAARRQALTRRLRAAAITATPLVLLVLAIIVSLSVAADRELRIEALEAKAQHTDLLTRRAASQRAEARALDGVGARDHAIADVLGDLDWLSRSRVPTAHIQAVHWEGGLMTITVRGQTPPVAVSDREVRKADRPLAPALWLWGVGRSPKGSRP